MTLWGVLGVFFSSFTRLTLVRGHWHIENTSHWVRDVTFDENRSQVRCGNIPQVMAALRNMVIELMREAGYTNIAAGGVQKFYTVPIRDIP